MNAKKCKALKRDILDNMYGVDNKIRTNEVFRFNIDFKRNYELRKKNEAAQNKSSNPKLKISKRQQRLEAKSKKP